MQGTFAFLKLSLMNYNMLNFVPTVQYNLNKFEQ